MDRGVAFLVSGASATLHFSLRVAFICMHCPSFSLHLHAYSLYIPFIGINFQSFSFHNPFTFIPMCIHVLAPPFHSHAFSFHIAFMSFHFLAVVEMALWLGQGTECNQWLSVRLSLKKPSNMTCSKEICHKERE